MCSQSSNPRGCWQLARARSCTAFVLFLISTALPYTLRSVEASNLLAPAVGAADSATQGTRIADPLTPSGALFANPAGLISFDTFTLGGSIGAGFGHARIEAAPPIPFAETNKPLTMVPDIGLSLPIGSDWRVGAGMYGSTGSTFDYRGNPAAGIPSMFSETIIMVAPIGAAYRWSDRLSLGATVEPQFGQLRTHFAQSGVDFRYRIYGGGLQGSLGATVRPLDAWSFGVSLRLPGRIWMDGSMPLGPLRQKIDCDLKMPTQLFIGATWQTLPKLTLSGSMRYTNSRTLGDSAIRYEQTPQANIGFLPYGRDEWRVALAGEYAVRPETFLRLGGSWASHIVGSKGMSPLVFDGDDGKLSLGVRQIVDDWVVDLLFGYAIPVKRHVASDKALVLPGSYSMDGMIVTLGIMYQ